MEVRLGILDIGHGPNRKGQRFYLVNGRAVSKLAWRAASKELDNVPGWRLVRTDKGRQRIKDGRIAVAHQFVWARTWPHIVIDILEPLTRRLARRIVRRFIPRYRFAQGK